MMQLDSLDTAFLATETDEVRVPANNAVSKVRGSPSCWSSSRARSRAAGSKRRFYYSRGAPLSLWGANPQRRGGPPHDSGGLPHHASLCRLSAMARHLLSRRVMTAHETTFPSVSPSETNLAAPILFFAIAASLLAPWLLPATAGAQVPQAVISEFVTRHEGSTDVQFVEISFRVESFGSVEDTVLGAFDASGSYLGDVLVVPENVSSTNEWSTFLMGTADLATWSGAEPDFVIPSSLPSGGGMICWGAPSIPAPAPESWDHSDPENYIDCVAYGTYSGPTNSRVGIPTAFDADGHGLFIGGDGSNDLLDFLCSQESYPEPNVGFGGFLYGDVPCPQTNAYTMTSPVPFSGEGTNGTVSGTLHPVAPSDFEGFPTCIYEGCILPKDGLFFRITLDAESDDLYAVVPYSSDVRHTFGNPKVGYLEDENPSTRSPTDILTAGGGKGPTFGLSSYMEGGEESDVLFVFYPYGLLAHEQSLGTVEFAFTIAPDAYQPSDWFSTESVEMVVPEPGAGLLAFAAAVAIGALARASGRRTR